MLLRSMVIWCVFAVLAVLNGALRDTVWTPRLGEPSGHIISTIILCIVMLIVMSVTMGWIAPSSPSDALLVGFGWLVMTVAFEFLVGHYVFGTSWARLLSDYDLLNGRIWFLVVATVTFGPFVILRARQFR